MPTAADVCLTDCFAGPVNAAAVSFETYSAGKFVAQLADSVLFY